MQKITYGEYQALLNKYTDRTKEYLKQNRRADEAEKRMVRLQKIITEHQRFFRDNNMKAECAVIDDVLKIIEMLETVEVE